MKHKLISLIVGIGLISAGTGLFMRGFHHNAPAPPAANPPNQALKLPAIQLNLSDANSALTKGGDPLRVSIKTSDYAAITRVAYRIDDRQAASSTSAPFTVAIPTDAYQPGQHSLQAYAYTKDGRYSTSETFYFTLNVQAVVTPADKSSWAIRRQAVSDTILAAAVKTGSHDTTNTTGDTHQDSTDNNNDGESNDNDNGDGNTEPDPDDTTPWPDTPPALLCGSSTLNGPAAAPSGAITVPAGDNSGVNFGLPNTTYWFAPGTHTLGTGQYSQIAPGNNSRFTGGPGAILDGQHLNNYAFTQNATNVTIEYLTIQNFTAPRDEGVINHDSADNWTIQYITAQNNGGGAVFLGTNGVLRYSCLRDNGQYGFQVYSSAGPTNVLLDHNEISGNNTDDWEAQVDGCGCTGGGKFWDAHTVTITNNYVHDNLSVGLWADTNDTDFLVEGNYIADNDGQGLFYEISYNMIVRNNTFIGNAVVNGPTNPSFPTGAIYLSESGGDNRVAGRTANIDIYDNYFDNNWAGVILWENADRYCASPNNTSTGTCTLVNPDATLAACGDPASGGSIDQEPYTSDCRWKTQNVKVHNNTFALDKSSIANCDAITTCGVNGIFSNTGSSPSWSPYMGSGVINDIVFNQNNLFSNNTYTGNWNFVIKDQSMVTNYAIWQNAPYNQDSGSTLNGQPHLLIANVLDDDTATLEGSVGLWRDWFNTTTTQSASEFQSGSHSLKVAAGDQFWGVNFNNGRQLTVTPTDKTVSFWAKQTVGATSAKLSIVWLDADSNTLRTDVIDTGPLTSTWQQFSADITPPVGVDSVTLRLASNTSANGQVIYFDNFVVGDKP